MENHTDIKPIGQVWDKTELDDINAWSKLTVLANESYSVGAAAKSAAGIGTPNLHLELTHALAWFFVSDRPPFFGVLFAYPAIGILSVMVARAGPPTRRSASSALWWLGRGSLRAGRFPLDAPVVPTPFGLPP